MRYSHDNKIDTYTSWQQAQKIPINRGFFIEDLTKVEVAPWEILRTAVTALPAPELEQLILTLAKVADHVERVVGDGGKDRK